MPREATTAKEKEYASEKRLKECQLRAGDRVLRKFLHPKIKLLKRRNHGNQTYYHE